ncbi:MAG: molybdopterin-dependent oxidoreductase, partial [Treponema sp.]|nr:molybdopterin-dependent oxidoreductase [Treponema sp.]
MKETARFASDMYLPEMLHVFILRSPVARGRLLSIEIEPEKMPEGVSLILARDIPGENRLWEIDAPLLSGGGISYIGEPLALLLGPDLGALEECAANCDILCEEAEPLGIDDEAFATKETATGNVEEDFAAVAASGAGGVAIIKSEHETGLQDHWHCEPCAAVAWIESSPPGGDEADAESLSPEATKKVVICAATQWPRALRESVALALGIAASEVELRPCPSDSALDGKLWQSSLIACQAALGAWISGRPTRLAPGKKEAFLFSSKRARSRLCFSSALDENGRLVATEIEARLDSGALDSGAEQMLEHLRLGSLGLYERRSLRFRGVAIKTNTPPGGGFAGFGMAQGAFALESHVSRIAESLGMDPAQWRLENLIKPGASFPGLPAQAGAKARELIASARRMSDYGRKWAACELLRLKARERRGAGDDEAQARAPGETLRGIGMALGCAGGPGLRAEEGAATAAVEVTLEKDGSLEIRTGMADLGPRPDWAEIARDTLGVEESGLRIAYDPALESGPRTMSRGVSLIARLIEEACVAIRGM